MKRKFAAAVCAALLGLLALAACTNQRGEAQKPFEHVTAEQVESLFITTNYYVPDDAKSVTITNKEQIELMLGAVNELTIYEEDTSGTVYYGTPVTVCLKQTDGSKLVLSSMSVTGGQTLLYWNEKRYYAEPNSCLSMDNTSLHLLLEYTEICGT